MDNINKLILKKNLEIEIYKNEISRLTKIYLKTSTFLNKYILNAKNNLIIVQLFKCEDDVILDKQKKLRIREHTLEYINLDYKLKMDWYNYQIKLIEKNYIKKCQEF